MTLTVPADLYVCFGCSLVDQKGAKPHDIADLEARLRAADTSADVSDAPSGGRSVSRSGMGLAFRIGLELVITTLVGALLGWYLDGWLGTRPWIMVACVVLGAAAGVSNVYRIVKGLDDSVGLGQASRRQRGP